MSAVINFAWTANEAIGPHVQSGAGQAEVGMSKETANTRGRGGMVRIAVAGSEVAEAMATLPGLYDGKRWNSRTIGSSYSFRYVAAGDAALTLRRSQMSGFIQGEIPPGDDYIVQWIDAGSSVLDVGRENVRQQLHQPLLFPPDREVVFTFKDYDQRLVHLNRDLVREVATEQYGTTGPALRFRPGRPAGADAVLRWRESVTAASRAMRESGTESLLWHEVTRDVAAAFLGMYRPQTEEPDAVQLPGRAAVRQAVEYVHDRVAGPITVTDIAEAADMSVRSLQEAFRRDLGVSPIKYLRHARLERVRNDLLHADTDTTVGAVAQRWGFAHLGRFSSAYAERYGEYPKATLRRGSSDR